MSAKFFGPIRSGLQGSGQSETLDHPQTNRTSIETNRHRVIMSEIPCSFKYCNATSLVLCAIHLRKTIRSIIPDRTYAVLFKATSLIQKKVQLRNVDGIFVHVVPPCEAMDDAGAMHRHASRCRMPETAPTLETERPKKRLANCFQTMIAIQSSKVPSAGVELVEVLSRRSSVVPNTCRSNPLHLHHPFWLPASSACCSLHLAGP